MLKGDLPYEPLLPMPPASCEYDDLREVEARGEFEPPFMLCATAFEFVFWREFIDALRSSVGVFTLASNVLFDACLRRAGDLGPAGMLCSVPNGAGFGLRAVVGGRVLETRLLLAAELGFREISGVVERGVGGRVVVAARCKLSRVSEARSSFSLLFVLFGGGGSGGSVDASGPEPLGAPECIIVSDVSALPPYQILPEK